MIKYLALTLVVSCGAPAHAETVLHGLSYHTDRDLIPEVNENNIGIGYRVAVHDRQMTDFEFGVYQNSYGDASAYLVLDKAWDSGLGLFVGVATGFNDDVTISNQLGAMPMLGVLYQHKYVTVRVSPTRSVDTGDWGAVVGVSMTPGG